MDGWLKQSTAVTVKVGPFVDSSDGDTAETALTIQKADVRLSKNGGNLVAASADQGASDAGAAHDENGLYDISLDTTDTGTLGRLDLHVKETGALIVRHTFMIVPANVWDSLFGADLLQVDVREKGSSALGLTTQEKADVNAEADTAIADYDPPTAAELTSGLGALNDPSAAAIADAVLDEALSGHTTAGTLGERIGRIPNAVAGGNGGLPTVDANNYVAGIQGTKNTLDDLSDPSAAAIADAVFDEALAGHTTAGTFGERAGRIPNAAAGGNGGLPTVDASNYIAGVQGTKNTLDDLNDPSAAEINAEVVDALGVDTIPELSQGQPSATPTVKSALMLLYMALRNKLTDTGSQKSIYDDAGTLICKSALSDDGSTFTKDKLQTGP